MNILVTGGAGYIGSHAVRRLLRDGHRLVVVDDYRHGHAALLRAACSEAPGHVSVVSADIADRETLRRTMRLHHVEAVMHFAAYSEVAESMADPLKYYANNVGGSIALLQVAVEAGVRRFVFSSTAAVYGDPVRVPIQESDALAPINPYGRAKMMVELALEDARAAHGIGYAILRYFNVAGAAADALLGEWHEPETHVIPRVLAAAMQPGAGFSIFGDDYPTPDGTCVRDYVHVEDLVDAHALALAAIAPGSGDVFNLGSACGFSVREVIAACEKVTAMRIPVRVEARRAGDPAVLVAASDKARERLRWSPRYPDLETIVAHAWAWHVARRDAPPPAARPIVPRESLRARTPARREPPPRVSAAAAPEATAQARSG